MAPVHRALDGGRPRERGRSAGVGGLLGVAVMAAVDEIVFHQVLAWHHFYDRATADIALPLRPVTS